MKPSILGKNLKLIPLKILRADDISAEFLHHGHVIKHHYSN